MFATSMTHDNCYSQFALVACVVGSKKFEDTLVPSPLDRYLLQATVLWKSLARSFRRSTTESMRLLAITFSNTDQFRLSQKKILS